MAQLEALLHRTLVGDRDAWQQLQAALEPTILAIARRNPALRRKGLAASDDDLREITVSSFERFARQDFRNLRRFVERASQSPEAGTSFDNWVYGAVEFVIREHLRQRFGAAPQYAAADAARPQPSKRDLNSQAARLYDHEDQRALMQTLRVTTKLTAMQIMEHIAKEFTADEAAAVRLYYVEEQDFEEIAGALGLGDAKVAERLIRRLNARLRYRFLPKTAAED
ncbi:MAG TPA: hypothetical protein VFG30_22380 [Polyangiales bacterium]|jgi:DNA-directed RNA polymerase specialized sigma24 family protein|nr:hypothetical protein [Polyangiales bacterium]